MIRISSAHVSLARTESHDPHSCQECWEMEFVKPVAHTPPPPPPPHHRFQLPCGHFLVCSSSVLPCHSLGLVLNSQLHISILSSDLSILSFHAPCYPTSSRDLCFAHFFFFFLDIPPFLGFFLTFLVTL